MVFSSLVFLFLFLPLVLLLYYCSPRRLRNTLILLANLLFYGWGEPVFLSIMLFSILSSYGFGLLIQRYRQHGRLAKAFVILSIATSLALLGFFKYSAFLADIMRAIPLFSNLPAPVVPLPIGISFYIFQTMSYTIDVYRGDTDAQRNVVAYGAYVSLFPQLIAGPIVRYKDVAAQLIERHETRFSSRKNPPFVVGLAKSLVANPMGLLWDGLGALNLLAGAWLALLLYSTDYFDFSGYSHMARGLGKFFGFEFMENFNYPYISRSISEFWRRWHISLSTWFRDYVYIPLGGNRRGLGRTILNLLIVWFLTGLWHGANYNYILWGLYYFALLALEKLFLKKWLDRAPAGIAHGYSLLCILLGWMLFYFEDLGQLRLYLTSMFTYQGSLLSPHAGYLALSYLPLLLAGIVASTPLGRTLYAKIPTGRCAAAAEFTLCSLTLLLCVAALVSQSYNPFLYFRF
ncbi:MAG: MBOAT family O-acyltransferase [Clostridia bacterium]